MHLFYLLDVLLVSICLDAKEIYSFTPFVRFDFPISSIGGNVSLSLSQCYVHYVSLTICACVIE